MKVDWLSANHDKTLLMTTDTVGGVWSYVINLLKEFQKYNIHVVLVTMGRKTTENQRNQVSKLKNVKLFEFECKLEWEADSWNDIDLAGASLLELEQRFKPELIHLNGYVHAALPWNAPTCVVAHSCVLSWYKNVLKKPAPSQWQEYKNRVNKGLHCAKCIVAPSNSMSDDLEQLYNIKSTTVIYNGIQLSDYENHSIKKQSFIFTAGRLWDKGKNIELVEKVAKYIPWKIVAAGDSGTLQYAKTNVCMLGKISSQSVKLWLRDASIYVLPVKYEPFGLSILEAAASGCALVLGNIDSAREIWDDAALYVDTDNPEQLKKTILTLIEDSDLLTEYSKKAKIRSNLFPIEKTALDYLNLYNSLSLQENKGDNI